jgi:hypothetical protein
MVTVSTGKTLAISGSFSGGRFQNFAGSGHVRFQGGKTDTVYPESFGAVGDGTTDDTTAMQAAILSACEDDFTNVIEWPYSTASAGVGLVIKLDLRPTAIYAVSDTLTLSTNTIINGNNATLKMLAGGSVRMSLRDNGVENLTTGHFSRVAFLSPSAA